MNYYGTDPARYAMHQQSRQDQKISNLLNMMMQMQAMKERRSKWEQEQSLQKEQLASIDRYRRAQEKEWAKPPAPPTPSSTMKTIEDMVAAGIAPNRKTAFDMFKGLKDPERIKLEAQMRAEGTAAGKPPTEPTITQYEKKKRDLKVMFDSGKITPAEYANGIKELVGVPTKTIDKTKDIKTNKAFVQKAFSAYGSMEEVINAAREQVKGVPGAVPTRDGVRLDMPTKYNVAQLNREYKIERPEDTAVIELYDEMFDTFLTEMLPKFRSFKHMLKASDIAKDDEIDLKQIRLWYKIYK